MVGTFTQVATDNVDLGRLLGTSSMAVTSVFLGSLDLEVVPFFDCIGYLKDKKNIKNLLTWDILYCPLEEIVDSCYMENSITTFYLGSISSQQSWNNGPGPLSLEGLYSLQTCNFVMVRLLQGWWFTRLYHQLAVGLKC